jgi:hypothetical protein
MTRCSKVVKLLRCLRFHGFRFNLLDEQLARAGT